jgi:hypothetical protein
MSRLFTNDLEAPMTQAPPEKEPRAEKKAEASSETALSALTASTALHYKINFKNALVTGCDSNPLEVNLQESTKPGF